MSQENNSIEMLRLEFEKARIRNDFDKTFLERWRTELQPALDLRLKSRDQGHDYAKLSMQTTFFLNGGALIAFPTFAQLVDAGFKSQLTWSLFSIGSFVLGLVFIALVGVCAMQAYSEDNEAMEYKIGFVKAGVHLGQAHENQKNVHKENQEIMETGRAKHYRQAVLYGRWAIGLGMLSLLSFVVGAGCATVVLSSAA